VADSETNYVYVISDSSNKVVASVLMGSTCVNPFGLAYDPKLGAILVSEIGGDSIVEISDRTNNVTGTIPVLGGPPMFIAYDQGQNEVFATDLNFNVSVVSLATNSSVTWMSTIRSMEPFGLTYDPSTGEIFIVDNNRSGLSAVSDESYGWSFIPINCHGTAAPSFELPVDVAYDPLNGNLYAACEDGGSLSVVSPENLTQFGTITLPGVINGGPIAIDLVTGTIWVAALLDNELFAISGRTGAILAQGPTDGYPGWGIAVDQSSGNVYVPQFKNESVGVFGPDAQRIAEIPLVNSSAPTRFSQPAPLPSSLGLLVAAVAAVVVVVVVVLVNRRGSRQKYDPLGRPLESPSGTTPETSGVSPTPPRGPG
jgi:DNA-binding beta-propeller fold protein YncE